MFGMCNYILSLLSAYERKSIDKLKIDFEDKGVFYEESRGPNWWNYYFEPLDLTPQSTRKNHECNLLEFPFNEGAKSCSI